MLVVEAWNDAGSIYLIFEYVDYFSGVTKWHGAGFQATQDDECLKLMELAGIGKGRFSAREIAATVGIQLYSLRDDEREIKILARDNANWTDDFQAVQALG